MTALFCTSYVLTSLATISNFRIVFLSLINGAYIEKSPTIIDLIHEKNVLDSLHHKITIHSLDNNSCDLNSKSLFGNSSSKSRTLKSRKNQLWHHEKTVQIHYTGCQNLKVACHDFLGSHILHDNRQPMPSAIPIN